jgi:hypothetical protein
VSKAAFAEVGVHYVPLKFRRLFRGAGTAREQEHEGQQALHRMMLNR